MADDEAMINEYQTIVRHIEDYTFFHTSVKNAKEVFPEAEQGHIIVLKDFDEGMVVFKEDFMEDDDKLKDFLALHMFPTVTSLSERALEQVLSENARKGIFLFRSEDNPASKKYEEEFRKVASEMRSKNYLFFQADIKSSLGQQIAGTFGVDESSLPVLQSVEIKEETIMYRYSGSEINEESIKSFIHNWQQGSLQRYYTSEPIPKENPGPIYKVVGKTFRQEVIDNDLSVIVKYYAPWCEYSKMIEPIYKKLAESMRDDKNVKFCEIDATKNDIEGFPAEGYPTIKFFPAKDKEDPIVYDGDLTEDALTKFVKERTNPNSKSEQEDDDEEETTTPKIDL